MVGFTDADLDPILIGDVAVHDGEAPVDLDHPQTQTGADPEEGGDDWQDVDGIPHPAEHLGAEQGVEARAHLHRQTVSVCHQGHQTSHNGVHNPAVDSCNTLVC